MGKLLGRLLRILAWLAPAYQFRASVYRKCGVKVGKNVYIGFLVMMDGEYPEYIEIEDETSIAPGVSIMAHSSASPFHQRQCLRRRERRANRERRRPRRRQPDQVGLGRTDRRGRRDRDRWRRPDDDTGPDRRPLAHLLLLRGAEHGRHRRHS